MQYRNDKFLIVKSIKSFILELESILITFPKKDYLNKDLVYKDALTILELIYSANNTLDEEKKARMQTLILAKISMIDFYLERAYKRKYISEKQCIKKSNELEQITKMIYGWIKSERTS